MKVTEQSPQFLNKILCIYLNILLLTLKGSVKKQSKNQKNMKFLLPLSHHIRMYYSESTENIMFLSVHCRREDHLCALWLYE